MTTAIPSAKTQFWLSVGSTVAAVLVPTAVTKAKPAVITVAATTGVTAGALIYVTGSGFPELDDKYFTAGAITGTSVALTGSNTTASTGTLGATPKAAYYKFGTDMEKLCVNAFTRQGGTSDTVPVGTFCDPTATIPGTSTAGTATFSGYMDPLEEGYLELLKADADDIPRLILIQIPDSKGSIVLRGTINGMSEDFTLGNAIAWTSGMALATAPTYIWP